MTRNIKQKFYHLFKSPKPEENIAIFRLENGELVEVAFFRSHPYDRKFLNYEYLGKGVFVEII